MAKTVEDLLKALTENVSSIQESQQYIVDNMSSVDSKLSKINQIESDITAYKDSGQIDISPKKNAVDANTIIKQGTYYCTNNTIALHYPVDVSSGFLDVYEADNGKIIQVFTNGNGTEVYRRVKISSENTFRQWYIEDYNKVTNIGTSDPEVSNAMKIYIAKEADGGNDLNNGLTSTTPVLTINRALEIATKIQVSILCFCFGPGEWGSFALDVASGAKTIIITNYTGGGSTTNPGNMPYFTNITNYGGVPKLYIDNIEVDSFGCLFGHNVFRNYNVVGYIQIYYNSTTIYFTRNCVIRVKKVPDSSYYGFIRTFNGGTVLFINCTITLDEDLSYTYGFIENEYGNPFIGFATTTVFNGATYTGRKFYTRRNGCIYFYSTYGTISLDSLPGTTAGSGNYSINGIPQTGVVHDSGNETIAGTKKFNSSPVVQGSAPSLYLVQTDVTKGTRPSVNQSSGISFYDSQGVGNAENLLGNVQNGIITDGRVYTGIYAYKSVANTNIFTRISVNILEDGTAYTITPQLRPDADNTHSLGVSNGRWSQLFAGTATINTSDEREKDNIDALPDAVLDAWGEVNFQQYQFKDAIAEKGENARLHSGVIAQRVMEVFAKYGLDATRYGLLCHDTWEAEDYDETIIDKEAVTETVKVVDKEAVYETRTVVEMDAYTDEDGTEHPAVTREEVYEVSPEESHEEERIVEPEVSHVEHHHKDAGDRYGIRYEEALCIEAAYQRRRADRMEARLAALEAKLK